MNLSLDILVIIIVAILAFVGYKKGLTQSLITVVGMILASMVSMTMSRPIAEVIYYGGFDDTIRSKFKDASALLARSGTGTLTDKLLETLPSFVVNSLPGFDISKQKMASAATSGAEAIEKLLRPIMISFISIIVASVLFFILALAVRVLARIISDRMDSFFFGSIDNTLGGVVGIIEGFVIVLVLSFILRISLPHMKKIPEMFSEDKIEQSTIFKGIYESPILLSFLPDTTESVNK